MTDEERQRTMDFILQQQAQFAASMQRIDEGMQKFEEGMQKLEEADARASKRLDRLERTLVLMAQRFRRERHDLRERIAALVDSQMRTEEAMRSLTVATVRNSRDIAVLNIRVDAKTESGGDVGEGTG
jgi:septal ring factor EnvC (AmiA/AmiB activator)